MTWKGLPSLSILRAFEAAARHRSFTEAGRELNVTYVAVAQQVRRLEAHLGVSLIYRNGRGLVLTAEGQRLSASLSEAMEIMHSAIVDLSGADQRRPLLVSLTPSFAVSWLMPRIGAFRAEFPDIELMLNPSAEIVDLKRGGYDLAIRFGSGNWPGLEAEPFLASQLVLVAAPSLLEGKTIETPEDLLKLPWLQELGTGELQTWFAARGVETANKVDITHLPGYMVMQALREGQGMACASRVLIEEDIAAGGLKVLLEKEEEGVPVGYFLVRRQGAMRPPLKQFVSWLRRVAKKGADEAAASGNGYPMGPEAVR